MVSLTWGLEHLMWMGCRSTWRHTTKECLPSESLCSLWDVTASVEVQPMGSTRLRLRCWPSRVYTLNWLRLTVHGKASPGGSRHSGGVGGVTFVTQSENQTQLLEEPG